jgi:hypothetical protein
MGSTLSDSLITNFNKYRDRLVQNYFEVQKMVRAIIKLRNKILNTLKHIDTSGEDMQFYKSLEKMDYVEMARITNLMKKSKEFHPTIFWETKKRSKHSEEDYESDELTE